MGHRVTYRDAAGRKLDEDNFQKFSDCPFEGEDIEINDEEYVVLNFVTINLGDHEVMVYKK